MNYIFLDYDAENSLNSEGFNNKETKVFKIRDFENQNENITSPSKGIIITGNSGGWQKYHSDFVLSNSDITHWVVIVIGELKKRVMESAKSEIQENFEKNKRYFEIIFVDSNDDLTEKLKETLEKKTKGVKSCLVLAKDVEFAKEICELLSFRLKDWEVNPCLTPESPDYELLDAVLVAGNSPEEMQFPAPDCPIAYKMFYINVPLYIDDMCKILMIKDMGKLCNKNGWNISDYIDITRISDFYYESLLVKLLKEEISTVSLVTADFSMWDSYGLPVKSEEYTDENIKAFIEKVCMLRSIAVRLENS